MSIEMRFSGEFVAHASLALALCLGMAACIGGEKRVAKNAVPTQSPFPSATASPTPVCLPSLESMSVNLVTPAASAYAINEGECVHVYSREVADKFGAISKIPPGGKFFIECFDLTVPTLRVSVNGLKGIVDLGDNVLQQFDKDSATRSIRTC